MQVNTLELESIEQALKQFTPRLIESSENIKRAAVCIILCEKDKELSLLMMQRAKRAGDPWSGHMAFPGGRIDATDESVFAGAVRELHEEMSVSDRHLEYIGQLSDIQAKHVPNQRTLVISAFVFKTKQKLVITPNHEVAKYYWIPLSLFETSPRRKMIWFRNKRLRRLPYYRYRKQRVWGLSLAMIEELFHISGRMLSKHGWHPFYQK